MKRTKRILLSIGCAALLIASWAAAVTAKSDAGRQLELMDQAAAYTADAGDIHSTDQYHPAPAEPEESPSPESPRTSRCSLLPGRQALCHR